MSDRECELCGFDISCRHGIAKYCWFCSEIILKIQNQVLQMKRPSRKKYMKIYNKYRRRGFIKLGMHWNKDFSYEYQLVHRELLRTFFPSIQDFSNNWG